LRVACYCSKFVSCANGCLLRLVKFACEQRSRLGSKVSCGGGSALSGVNNRGVLFPRAISSYYETAYGLGTLGALGLASCGGRCGSLHVKESTLLYSLCLELSPSRPRMKREDPPNLSILLSGGKETNKDSPSNGE
jgi:hypothetical protein